MRIDYPRRARTGLRRWWPSWRQWLILAILAGSAVVAAFFVAVALTPVPPPNEVARAETSIVYYRDGKTEIGRLGQANRISIPLTDVPLHVQHAVLAAEDRDFYEHGGFSPVGIGRALWNNVQGGSTQGASTITQQYIKNAFLTADRTWSRKISELVLSVKLESTVSKDQILENYLNTIYFGRGAYGIETAASAYYRKHARDLTLSEGAALAALIRSPGGYNPDTESAKLEGRWKYVLDGMVQKGWLTPSQKRAAVFPKFRERPNKDRFGGQSGYLLDTVRRELVARGYTESDLTGGGFRVVTTIDKLDQDAAVQAVADAGPTSKTRGLRIGLASVQPGTGDIVALYGGKDFLTNQISNATRAIGQAGSTFKPFALAAALENDIGLNSTWDGNSPQTVSGYKLRNYDNSSYGTVSLRRATEESINTAYVELTNQLGVDTVIDAAFRAGIPQNTPGIERNLTFVLGTASPHALDLAGSYATFAAHGQRADPTILATVRAPDGTVLYQSFPQPRQAFDADVADQVTKTLEGVVTNGTGFAAQKLGRPAAGKTGTTDNNMSAWFVGYTPQLSTAVMMVKDSPSGNPVSLAGTGGLDSVTGGSFPAEIWTAFTDAALAGLPVEGFGGSTGGGGGSGGSAPEPPSTGAVPSSSSPSDSASPSQTTTGTPSGSATATPGESSGAPSDSATPTVPTDSGAPDVPPAVPPTESVPGTSPGTTQPAPAQPAGPADPGAAPAAPIPAAATPVRAPTAPAPTNPVPARGAAPAVPPPATPARAPTAADAVETRLPSAA